ncbi:hypothetical protein GCM10009736_36220 [Actinomadura bangladeshensis]
MVRMAAMRRQGITGLCGKSRAGENFTFEWPLASLESQLFAPTPGVRGGPDDLVDHYSVGHMHRPSGGGRPERLPPAGRDEFANKIHRRIKPSRAPLRLGARNGSGERY